MDDKTAKRDKKSKPSLKCKTPVKLQVIPKKKNKSDSEFRHLFSSINQGMAIHEMIYDAPGKAVDYRITDINQVYERIAGVLKKDVIGKTPGEIYKIKKPPYLDIYAGVASSGKPVSFETYFKPKGLYLSIFVFSTKEGTFTTIFSDVTAQKKVEETLKNANQKTGDILGSIQTDFYVLDSNWNFIFASETFTSRIGREPKDFVGKNIWKMFPKHIGTEFEENLRAAMKKKETRRFEVGGRYTDAYYEMVVFPSESGVTVLGSDITDRKRTENGLKESEERFRTMADAMPQLVWTANSDGVIDYFNARSAEYRVAVTELTDHDWTPALHPDDVASTLEAWREAVARGVIYQKEQRLRVADGSYRWHLARATPQRDKNGVIIKWFGTTTDIHDLKLAEQLLKESEMRLRLAMHNAPVSVAVQDPDLKYVWAYNQRSATQDQIVGHYDREIFTAAEAEHFTAVKRRVIREGINLNQKMWVDRPGGRMFMDIYWEPIRDESGKVIGVGSTTVDLTATKRTEEALNESEERYRALVDLAPDAILVHRNGDIRYANATAIRLFGASSYSELAAHNILDLIHPEDRDKAIANIQFAEQGHVTEMAERRAFRINGQEWTMEAAGSPVYWKGERCVQVIIRNITERKETEERLRNALSEAEAGRATLKALMDNIPIGITIADAALNIQMVSEYAQKLLGPHQDLKVSDVTARWKVYQEDGVTPMADKDLPLVRAASGENVENMELVQKNEQGEALHLLCSSSPIRHGDQITGAIVAWRDISELRLAGDALKTSEAKYRNLFVNMTEGFALCDIVTDVKGKPVDYRVLEANKTWEELTGLSLSKIANKPLKEMIPGLEQYWVDNYGKVALTGEPMHLENYNAFTDRWYEIYAYSPAKGYFVSLVQNITQRKKTEMALTESEGNFRRLWDTMSMGVVYQNAGGQIISMNPAAERILGHSPQDYLGSSSVEQEHFTIKEDGLPFPGNEHPAMVALRTGQKSDNIVMGVYNPRDQSYHWINVSSIPLFRPGECKPYQVYAIFDDITERRNSEEQLRQRVEELKTVMDLVPAAIWVAHDPECHNITGNRTANEFYEAKEGENVSAGPASGEPVPPRRFFRNGKELKAEELPMQEAAARNQDVKGSEFEVEVPSGKSLTLMGAASPLRDEKGKVRGAVAAFLDITARREIEKQYFEHLRILEQANVFVRDMDGKIVYWNMGAEKIYGYSMDEAIGRISHELLKTEFPESLLTILSDLMAKGKWEGDLIHTRKDGVKIISSSVWTYYQADKNLPGMIIEANTDITERKKAEEAAAEYSKNLEIANRELEAFSYSVSHDLQAPLRALDSFSELLIEDYGQKIDETGQDYLNRIRKASQTMSQLINDMLKLSRIIRSTMQEEMVDISGIAESIAAELGESRPDRTVKFVIEPDILIAGDPGLLEIALTNLLENAWKYTSKNPNALIEFGKIQQSGEKVFFVRDNGIGIDMTYRDKLFQPFQRLTDKEYPGTGIGLAIVQRIIQRHGGRIWAESEIGKGATFYFTIGNT